MDFLDILRKLTKDNINNDPKLRDEFFNLLIKDDSIDKSKEEIPDERKFSFENQWYNGLKEEYENKYGEEANFYLFKSFCNYIVKYFAGGTITNKDVITHIRINSQSDNYYITTIIGIKEIITQEPKYFSIFKEILLLGLIEGYFNRVTNKFFIHSDRLNKLLLIYAEHTRNIELSEAQFSSRIIDEELLTEISRLRINLCKEVQFFDIECLKAIHNLLNKRFPESDEKNYDFKIEDILFEFEYANKEEKRIKKKKKIKATLKVAFI